MCLLSMCFFRRTEKRLQEMANEIDRKKDTQPRALTVSQFQALRAEYENLVAKKTLAVCLMLLMLETASMAAAKPFARTPREETIILNIYSLFAFLTAIPIAAVTGKLLQHNLFQSKPNHSPKQMESAVYRH